MTSPAFDQVLEHGSVRLESDKRIESLQLFDSPYPNRQVPKINNNLIIHSCYPYYSRSQTEITVCLHLSLVNSATGVHYQQGALPTLFDTLELSILGLISFSNIPIFSP